MNAAIFIGAGGPAASYLGGPFRQYLNRQPSIEDFQKAMAQKQAVAEVWCRTQDFNDPDYLEALKELKRLEWWTYPNENCEIVWVQG